MSEPENGTQDVTALLDRAYALGYEYEQRYGSCPQCVLAALEAVLGPGDAGTFKAAQVLAGGGALSGRGTCGALAGGMLALSARDGREREQFTGGALTKVYKVARRLSDRFVEEYGSLLCADVQTKLMGRSFDLLDRGQYQEFEAAGGHQDKCPEVVAKVARWTAEMLLE